MDPTTRVTSWYRDDFSYILWSKVVHIRAERENEFAYQALQADLEVGLILPWNLIVYEDDEGRVQLAALNPVSVMEALESSELEQAAEKVAVKLRRVVERVGG